MKIKDIELLIIISELPEPYGVPIFGAMCAKVGPWFGIIPAEWRLSSGQMYVQLTRLEHAGLLFTEWSRETYPERGNRRRRYYYLTSLGKARVQDYRNSLHSDFAINTSS